MTTDQFRLIKLDQVHQVAEEKHRAHWRCLQMHCTAMPNGIDITYTYQKDGVIDNLMVRGVTKDQHVPSITDVYIGLFPFENEAHDLFGVQVDGIAIDFKGRFYDTAVPEPMTIISPEKKARMDKAARVAKAKAAKEAKTKGAASGEDAADKKAAAKEALEKKLASMDPEKAAKVRAAMEAKEKREAAKAAEEKKKAQEAALEEKLKNMDPEKAAKVRAAMEAKAKREAAKAAEAKEGDK
jgi:primosomal protein N'